MHDLVRRGSSAAWVKWLVLVGFAGLFSGFAYSASLLTQEFEFTDMVPDDSYVKEFYDALDDYSTRSSVVPDVVFRFVNQSDTDIQDQMEEYVADLVTLDEVVDPPPSFWLEDFKKFTNSSTTSDLPFNQQLNLFLADPVYHELYDDQISRDVNGDIIASRCELSMDNVDFNDVKQQIDALENQRTVTASQDINQDKKDWPFFTYAEA
jgi:predicted RND superfamily exporter protein